MSDTVDHAWTELEAALRQAMTAMEEDGMSAADADDAIKEIVFQVWWDWEWPLALSDGSGR